MSLQALKNQGFPDAGARPRDKLARLDTVASRPEADTPAQAPRKRLGELLIERGKLDPVALERALRLQQDSGGEKIGSLLVTLGLVAQRDVAEALAGQL